MLNFADGATDTDNQGLRLNIIRRIGQCRQRQIMTFAQ